jgi:hypothetical protein
MDSDPSSLRLVPMTAGARRNHFSPADLARSRRDDNRRLCDMDSGPRARRIYGALALCTIVVGLIVHWYATVLPAVMRDVLGDALWAMMIVWLIGAIFPQKPIVRRAVLALVIC